MDLEDTRDLLKLESTTEAYNNLPNSIIPTEIAEIDAALLDSLQYLKRTFPWTVSGLLMEVKTNNYVNKVYLETFSDA